MRAIALLALTACSLVLSGCVVRTAADIVTAPFRAGAQVVDWATTSQSEADEKRGRELRKDNERLGKLDRKYREQRRDCERGNDRACKRASATYDEIADILAASPAVR